MSGSAHAHPLVFLLPLPKATKAQGARAAERACGRHSRTFSERSARTTEPTSPPQPPHHFYGRLLPQQREGSGRATAKGRARSSARQGGRRETARSPGAQAPKPLKPPDPGAPRGAHAGRAPGDDNHQGARAGTTLISPSYDTRHIYYRLLHYRFTYHILGGIFYCNLCCIARVWDDTPSNF